MDYVLVCLIILSLVGLLIALGLSHLVRLRQKVQQAFAPIEAQLQRRYSLAPLIVEISKESITEDRESLEGLIRARNQALSAMESVRNLMTVESLQKLSRAEAHFAKAIQQYSEILTKYPDLKSSAGLQQALVEMFSVESQMPASRKAFNDSVLLYNKKRETFPFKWMVDALALSVLAILEA